MKQQKALAASITEVVQTKLKESGDQPKVVNKTVKKAAGKLAKKLTKLFKKADKKQKKADKEKKEVIAKALKETPVVTTEVAVVTLD